MKIEAITLKPVVPPPTAYTLTLSASELHDVAVMVAAYEMNAGRLRNNPIDNSTHDYLKVKTTLVELYQINVGGGR